MLGNRGFSVLEVVLASTMLVGTMAAVSAGMRQYSILARGNRGMHLAQMEHEALRKMVSEIPLSQATSVICPYPHPYMNYNPNSAVCELGRRRNGAVFPTPNAAQINEWRALSDEVYRWSSGAINDPVLSAGGYSTTVVPRLRAAGCIDCHDGTFGGTNPVMVRDFTQYTVMDTVPKLAGRMMMSTKLGKRLLRPTMPLRSMIAADGTITHQVNFILPGNCEAPDEIEREFRTPNQADASCTSGATCNPGEYVDPLRCAFWCSEFAGAGSSNTPTDCTEWTRRAFCFIPRVRCSALPACPSGRVYAAGSCQENASSPSCGNGATTWRCVNPLDPAGAVAGTLQFTVLTTFSDTSTVATGAAATKHYSSEGSLR